MVICRQSISTLKHNRLMNITKNKYYSTSDTDPCGTFSVIAWRMRDYWAWLCSARHDGVQGLEYSTQRWTECQRDGFPHPVELVEHTQQSWSHHSDCEGSEGKPRYQRGTGTDSKDARQPGHSQDRSFPNPRNYRFCHVEPQQRRQGGQGDLLLLHDRIRFLLGTGSVRQCSALRGLNRPGAGFT